MYNSKDYEEVKKPKKDNDYLNLDKRIHNILDSIRSKKDVDPLSNKYNANSNSTINKRSIETSNS